MKRKGLTRRKFIKGAAAASAAIMACQAFKARASSSGGIRIADLEENSQAVIYRLTIERRPATVAQRPSRPITINGSFPGPLIRLKEGKEAVIKVVNRMDEPTSVHWHGILLPYQMDGVPGVVFPGIPPGGSFTYRFPVRQAGTYWYHSHTGLQEQLGHYGPLICEPRQKEPFDWDREHIVLLSDWTFEEPEAVLMHLKKWEGYYNYHKRTIVDLFRDIGQKGLSKTIKMRSMWARMRMNPRDIADVTGATYTYLINGMGPEEGHVLPFRPGERIRLRIINASASTYFDLAIPGLKMTVVQADGQNVSPVPVDELRIAVAETYDVLVEPDGKEAYAIFAAAMDRSGFALASLSSDPVLKAKPPALGPVPEREIMGMTMMGSAAMQGDMAEKGAGHEMKKGMPDSPCGDCTPSTTEDFPFGPDAAMIVREPKCMIGQPGLGLPSRKGAKALCYSDLKALDPMKEKEIDRRIEIHLTGNMERFIWKMFAWDGRAWSSKFHQLLDFPLSSRIEIVFVNHTMMDHPIHLHGMWMRLANGHDELAPKKHTINIKPAEKLCVQVDADAFGNWAFHCHILYHMHTGMFRVVRSC